MIHFLFATCHRQGRISVSVYVLCFFVFYYLFIFNKEEEEKIEMNTMALDINLDRYEQTEMQVSQIRDNIV